MSKRISPAQRLQAEIDEVFAGGEDLAGAIEQVAVLGARLLLQAAIEAEVTAYLEYASGHRSVPHTADLRIEAWAPTRNGCIRQAVLGAVQSFLDTSSAKAQQSRRRRVTGDRDDDLLVAAVEEVIYLLDTTREAPVDVELNDADGGVDMTFAMVDASTIPQVSAVPKAVSLNELHLSQGRSGWRCAVTLDV